MSDTILEAIKKYELTSKTDVLQQVKKKIAHYSKVANESPHYPPAYYALMILLLNMFYEKISNAVLFEELPDYWVYCLEYEYDEFSLVLEHIKEYKLDENNEFKSSKGDAVYKMITISPLALTVEQYSRIYNVEQGTVRQWIRRGKIRSAFKEGNEWKIPELSPPPSRGYEAAQYKWVRGIDNLPDEYSYLKDYVLATFYQDRQDKSKYHVLFVSKETFLSDVVRESVKTKNKALLLNAKDREKLELFMISHPQIKYCGHMI